MKINYKILWIEDKENSVVGFVENLENNLNDNGFLLDVDFKKGFSDEQLEELIDKMRIYNPYDLILFDYDLGVQKGNEIAKKIRMQFYTDMIFYSGNPSIKLREILYKDEIEGVFTVSRTNFDVETWLIVEDQIKRVCDINNMRGMILDEMCKIDQVMRKLFIEKFNDLSTEAKNQFAVTVKEAIRNSLNDNLVSIEGISKDNITVQYRNQKKTKFDHVRKGLNRINSDPLFDNYGDIKYYQELRNKFAHNEASYNNEEGIITLSNYSGDALDYNEFIKIRKGLIKISNQLENMM